MRLDWYVLTVILFSDKLMKESNSTYQQLFFFTTGIAALYPTDDTSRNAVNDDDDTYGIDLLVHEIEQAHGKNYAAALYLALKDQDSPIVSDVKDEDITHALGFCAFQRVLKEFISLDDLSDDQLDFDAETTTGIKLDNLIGTLISPLPGSDGQVFYFSGDDSVDTNVLEEVALLPSNDIHIDVDGGESGGRTPEEEPNIIPEQLPLFFRIFLDGNAASQQDIRAVKKR
jgi:hypothetical protein